MAMSFKERCSASRRRGACMNVAKAWRRVGACSDKGTAWGGTSVVRVSVWTAGPVDATDWVGSAAYASVGWSPGTSA